MSAVTPPVRLPPTDVERASERDGKHYELIDGELKEKPVGFEPLFIARRIAEHLNRHFFPASGATAVEVMFYYFGRSDHGAQARRGLGQDRPLTGIPRSKGRLAPRARSCCGGAFARQQRRRAGGETGRVSGGRRAHGLDRQPGPSHNPHIPAGRDDEAFPRP